MFAQEIPILRGGRLGKGEVKHCCLLGSHVPILVYVLPKGTLGSPEWQAAGHPGRPRAELSHSSLLAGPLLISLVALAVSRLHEISLGVISLERIHSRSSQAFCHPP